MKQQHPVPASPWARKTRLAQALTFALGLGTVGAIAAPPQASDPFIAHQHAGREARSAATAQASPVHPNATTRYVQNCNDSGPGSLRATVAQASSGDTVDMSTMPCSDILLATGLYVPAINLTLVGKASTGPDGFPAPGTLIRSNGAFSTITHSNVAYPNVVLTLENLIVTGGKGDQWGTGGCIQSTASVLLVTTHVRHCTARPAIGSESNAHGGGIYAWHDVTLSSFSQVSDNTAYATEGDARGAGIYAGRNVSLLSHSSVSHNLATSEEGNMLGAGVYAEGWVDVNNGSVTDNEARSQQALQQTFGIGIYSAGDSELTDARINGNFATYPAGTSQYNGKGVGVYTADGLIATRSEFRGNQGWISSGGGIYTDGFVDLWQSTVADNSGVGTAAIYARGNATIVQSTISGNTSRDSAVMKLGDEATSPVKIESSTISGNRISESSSNGAALALKYHADILYSTITGNIERSTTDTKYGAGLSLGQGVQVRLLNTIVAGNSLERANGSQGGSDISESKDQTGAGILPASDFNMVSWTSLEVPNTSISGDPRLEPLRDNGGPTLTHLPHQDSPVVNAGMPNIIGLPDHDQRGFDRLRPFSTHLDIGAVEMTRDELYDRIFRDDFDHGAG